ncbi:phosphopantetheine-binding protein [Parasphingorhabdus sp.]|uniref:phosphopantetheine-binding protein n=1 Tax=Parasphingorhabdus sp. TaxID=2709688 RepID=UPI003A951D87
MTREELKRIFAEELETIAPEVDLSMIAETDNIQEYFDLDSMDIFNLLAALHQRLSIDIPDKDASKLLTVKTALDYLVTLVPE